MPINYPIAENLNPYDSASLIRSQGTSGDLVDNPINYRQTSAPVQGPVQSPSKVPQAPVTPTAPVSVEPTIGEQLATIKNEALRVQDILNSRSTKNIGTLAWDTNKNPYEAAIKPIDERAIQRAQMKLFQKEIDATNRVYNDMLQQERLAGQGRLGSQTAIAARSGLVGSDFGEAARQNQVSMNLQAERAVENERLAKIGTIMGTMRKAVADEIANKRLARTQDADTYVKYLAAGKERRSSNINLAAQSIFDAGLDIDTLDKSELEAIAKEGGISVNEIITQYKALQAGAAESDLKTRKSEADIKKIEADIAKGKLITIGEGTMLYNTETGETFKNPKTYAPGGGGTFDTTSMSEAAQALENSRNWENYDGYANTNMYLDFYNQAIEGGALPQEFLSKFPPDLYLRPDDPGIPPAIKSKMKSSDGTLVIGGVNLDDLISKELQ